MSLPIALTEDQPLATKSLEESLASLADKVAAGLRTSVIPRHPALDLVRRAAAAAGHRTPVAAAR